MIKYKSNGTWFDKDSIARLIDDYSDSGLSSGLFIGLVDGLLDEEICSFDEFEKVEILETDTEVDKAWEFQNAHWKNRKD